MQTFHVTQVAQHAKTRARVLVLHTPHGEVTTPVFMPVGTRAGVNNMTPQELIKSGSQLILGGNTYHMLCAPGMAVIEAAGGMHPFMGWHGPMLTDSGGFQVFSLSKNSELCKIDEHGATFVVPETGKTFHMTPTVSMQTQKIIGADIIMAFDQCTPNHVSHDTAIEIMNRTHRWLEESVGYHQEHPCSHYGSPQALFGIVQGGCFDDLRSESAAYIANMNLDGIALGGESIGFDMSATVDIIQSVYPQLPKEKPRYTMGVGMSPQDLLDVIEQGIDMFDCVAPTRNARHGALYCGKVVEAGPWLRFESEYEQGRLQIKKAMFANDSQPIQPGCTCWTCEHHSRAYLHQLYKEKAIAFTALASIHNIHVMHAVCERAREHILTTT
ncbi:MAG: tRNA guanosine(34) transglycosylase Tgt [Gammaproteobacteria bacterium]|nr:tRNA guanosine(34) transglycosylase Tgt [Gammaproteobacteria bacterium]